ncbi:MAG: NAD(P)/FAD-dependent oxidoreductase [Bryobacteraceae bacterium]
MSNYRIQSYDAIVLGAGAAGLMCAIEAGKWGRRVAVLEREDRAGKKILISGGGRCNFTNRVVRADNFLSANPHFSKSALARYTPADFIQLVEKHRIPYHEKTLGQLFCDRSSRDIMNMLEEECRAVRVDIVLNARIQEIRRTTEFAIIAGDAEFRAPALAVATGGLSIPKMGATGFGYEVARQFGHGIVECRPALAPLTLGAADLRAYGDLAGVSMEVEARFGSRKFHEKMLVTHRGLSGPAILQISSYWAPPQPISIDLAPGWEPESRPDLLALKSAMRERLPKRFADRWLELHTPVKRTGRMIEEIERQLHDWKILPAGTEGYEKAEVTAGGVDTRELSSKTMESRRQSGLFFIGEVVDVTGHLGGFNFQWAWASGFCAGQAV